MVREGDSSIFDCLERRRLILENDKNFPSIVLSSKLRNIMSSFASSNVFNGKYSKTNFLLK